MTFRKPMLLLAASVFSFAFSASAQTADEVIAKHIEAVGGLANWKKVNSTIITGSINAGGTEMPMEITTVNGMEFTMNGMTNYTILTPTEGWMFFPAQGQTKAEAVPSEMIKEQQDELDVTMDPLIDYKSKGSKVTYLGKDNVEGTECHKIKLVNKNGKEETIFIDISSNYCIRVTEKTKANGKEDESATTLGNYQKLPEGIVFPMSIEADGAPITIKTVEINKPIDESIFKPSETKK